MRIDDRVEIRRAAEDLADGVVEGLAGGLADAVFGRDGDVGAQVPTGDQHVGHADHHEQQQQAEDDEEQDAATIAAPRKWAVGSGQ